MEDTVQQELQQLNLASRSILTELEKEELSLDHVQHVLDRREVSIRELGILSRTFNAQELPKEKQVAIQSLFNDFMALNKRIQNRLGATLDQYRENLADATKRREAEDKYNALKTPDISYF